MAENDDAPRQMQAAEALRMIDAQRAAVDRPQLIGSSAILALWGLAYLIGFGVVALAPQSLERFNWRIVVFGLSMILGMIGSIMAGISGTRGIRGQSARMGTWIGTTWGGAFLVAGQLFRVMGTTRLGPSVVFQLSTAISILLVGALYLMMGAMLQVTILLCLGIWFLVIDLIGLIVGAPGYLLVSAILGGGAMLIAALAQLILANRKSSR